MRYLYTLIVVMLLPFMWLRLYLPGSRRHGYNARFSERLGFLPALPHDQPYIWVHAASVGEINAAAVLIRQLQHQYPNYRLMITSSTPTGSNRVKELFQDTVSHVYLPLDIPFAVLKFLKTLKPQLGMIMETELWPNLYYYCKRYEVPLMIANARMSAKSLRARAPLLRSWVKATLSCVELVAAQSRLDAARYRLLGVPGKRIRVVGNLKFEQPVDKARQKQGDSLRSLWGQERPVWMLASSHEGEEALAIDVHRHLLERWPNALLIVVPRHPERFQTVIKQVESSGLKIATRSTDKEPGKGTQCFVVDSMGEMGLYYAASDVAVVGGSFVAVGGHNILEAAMLDCALIVGPDMHNFADICTRFLAADALCQVTSSSELLDVLRRLFSDPDKRHAMQQAAHQLIGAQQGALSRTLCMVDQLLP